MICSNLQNEVWKWDAKSLRQGLHPWFDSSFGDSLEHSYVQAGHLEHLQRSKPRHDTLEFESPMALRLEGSSAQASVRLFGLITSRHCLSRPCGQTTATLD